MLYRKRKDKHRLWAARVEVALAIFVVELSKVRKIDVRETVRELNERYLGKGRAKTPNNYSATPVQRYILEDSKPKKLKNERL